MKILNSVKNILGNQKNESKLSDASSLAVEFSEYEKISRLEFRKDDIFIVSYPKSGNTWARFIIANLLNKDENEIINFRSIEKYVPDIHKSYNLLSSFKSPRFIKSHSQHYDLFPKFIYIIRDGRDALISFYHYYLDWKAFNGTFSDFLKSDLPVKNYGNWGDHVKNAITAYYKNPERILLLKYEQMLADPKIAVKKIANFCKIPVSEDSIIKVVEKCSFEMLKENEKKFGSEIQNLDMTFFRKGKSNEWQNYFTEEDHDFFLWHHSDMLIKNGYNINYQI